LFSEVNFSMVSFCLEIWSTALRTLDSLLTQSFLSMHETGNMQRIHKIKNDRFDAIYEDPLF